VIERKNGRDHIGIYISLECIEVENPIRTQMNINSSPSLSRYLLQGVNSRSASPDVVTLN